MSDYTFRQLKPVNYRRTAKTGILAYKLTDDWFEAYADNEREGIDIVVPMLRLLKTAPERVRTITTIHPASGEWFIGKQKIRNQRELQNYLHTHGDK